MDPPEAWRAEPQARLDLTPGAYTVTFIVRTGAENDTLHFYFSSSTGNCGAFGPVPDPLPAAGNRFQMTGHVGCHLFVPQP